MKNKTLLPFNGLIKIALASTLLCVGLAHADGDSSDQGIVKAEQKQDARIQEGVKSGKLTPAQAQKLEAKQKKIEADRVAATKNGKLDKKEKHKLKKMEKKAHRELRRDERENGFKPAAGTTAPAAPAPSAPVVPQQ